MSYKNMLANYPISDGWAQHVARGSLGGIDFVAGVGTPVLAPTDGRLENVQSTGTAGWYVKFWHQDGSGKRDEFMHLSRFVNAGYYKQGDVIGYSGGKAGAPGAGSSTGPHIHWHLILSNGKRVNPLDYVDGKSPVSTLGGWKGLQAWLKSQYGYAGPIDGIPGPNTWKAMQRFVKASYGYTGVVDGIPGPKTWKATQTWLNRYYGYNGAIDGIPGPMTNAALNRAGNELGIKYS